MTTVPVATQTNWKEDGKPTSGRGNAATDVTKSCGSTFPVRSLHTTVDCGAQKNMWRGRTVRRLDIC